MHQEVPNIPFLENTMQNMVHKVWHCTIYTILKKESLFRVFFWVETDVFTDEDPFSYDVSFWSRTSLRTSCGAVQVLNVRLPCVAAGNGRFRIRVWDPPAASRDNSTTHY